MVSLRAPFVPAHGGAIIFAIFFVIALLPSLAIAAQSIPRAGASAHLEQLKEVIQQRPNGKINVSILGGGMGGLTSAFYLANSSVADRLNITVYQMGWRLGGKAATGRNTTRDYGMRIEEHGIHMLFTFYHNAWEVLRTVYADLNRPATHPIPTVRAAFADHPEITFVEQRDGKWERWPVVFPKLGPAPWERPIKPPSLDLKSPGCASIQFGARWLSQFLSLPAPSDYFVKKLTKLITLLTSNTGDCSGKPWWLLAEFVEAMVDIVQDAMDVFRWSTFREGHACDLDDDVLRHACWMGNLGLATLKGLMRDRPTSFVDLDKYDFLEWLLLNGLPKELSNIPIIESVYISGFAWENGDLKKPDFAAGAALQTVLLTAGDYEGHWSYYMRAGTGETLVQPLYEWLVKRGVNFKFFHRIVDLIPTADGTMVDRIDVDIQAQMKNPALGYQPLIDMDGLEVWPSEPLWDQLVNGNSLKGQVNFESAWSSGYPVQRISLRRGVDFDVAISAMSMGPLKYAGQHLMNVSPKFRAMVEEHGSTPTFSVQMWFNETDTELGAKAFANDTFNVVSYAPPFYGAISYAHVLPFESWSRQAPPNVAKDVLYFSLSWDTLPGPHPFNDSTYPERELQHLREVAAEYMDQHLQWIYPGATFIDGTLNEKKLVPGQKFANQFFKVNIDPNERYVLTPKGKTKFRLPSDGSTFANLFLAGDYTLNGLNIGCIESTVRSGLAAALAIIDLAQPGWYVEPAQGRLEYYKDCAPLFQYEYCSKEEAVAAQQGCKAHVRECARDPNSCFKLVPSKSYCYPGGDRCSDPVVSTSAGHGCSWYSNCLENKYHCGLSGYPLGYGNYYCRLFNERHDALSRAGQHWLSSTRACLIRSGAQLLMQPNNNVSVSCSDVKKIAFDTHPVCYTQPQASFCDLPLSDVWTIVRTYRLKDIFALETVKQMMKVAKICFAQGKTEVAEALSQFLTEYSAQSARI